MVIYQVVWRVLNLTAYYYSGRAVLFVLLMEEEEEMVGRQFNSFEELKRTFGLSRLCEKYS